MAMPGADPGLRPRSVRAPADPAGAVKAGWGADRRATGEFLESGDARPGRVERHRPLERGGPHVVRDLHRTAQRRCVDRRLRSLLDDSANEDGQLWRPVELRASFLVDQSR
jgi:hypothetical protein